MAQITLTVADDLVVSIDYLLRLDDDEIVEASKEPLQFIQGKGQVVSGLEQALYGMEIGEAKDVAVAPADGYGEYDESRFQTFSRKELGKDLELEVGDALRLRDSATDTVHVGYVSELRRRKVVLDFNHPLASKTLHYNVKVVAIRPATSEELKELRVFTRDYDD